MSRRFWLARSIRYYRSKGIIQTIRRLARQFKVTFFRKPDVLFYADLTKIKKEFTLPSNLKIEQQRSEEGISEQDLSILFDVFGEKILRDHLKNRFSKGAVIWLIKVDGVLAGYIWSIVGASIEPTYFPLATSDVHFFDGMIFEGFRGQGLHAILVNTALFELRKQGLIRAFGEINLANIPSLRSFDKTIFVKYALARKCSIGRRNCTIWSKVK